MNSYKQCAFVHKLLQDVFLKIESNNVSSIFQSNNYGKETLIDLLF